MPPVSPRFGVALSVLALTALSVGCTGAPAPAPGGGGDAASAGSGAAAAPAVNRVVFITTPPARALLEVRHMAEPYNLMIRPMHEYLIDVNEKTGKLEPGLATEWSYEPSGNALRVKLRQNVPFHKNGGTLTADDVKFGWEQVTLPDSLTGQAPYWRRVAKSIDVVNDNELLFNTAGPDGNIVAAISEEQSGVEVQSRASFTKNGPATYKTGPYNGTGPYQYADGAEGVFIRYDRVPYKHWRAMPDFPELELRFAKEASTRQAALLAGEAHIAQLPEDLLNQSLKQGMKTVRATFPGVRVWGTIHCCYVNDVDDDSKGWKFPDSPLMDVRVRKAINKSINRDEINKALYGGKGELMIVNHQAPNRPGWNPNWEKTFKDDYGYDPAAAKKLLADAGQPSLKTTVYVQPVAGLAGGEDLAEAVGGYMRAVGINVEMVTVDAADFTNKKRTLIYGNGVSFAATGSNIWSGYTIWNSALGTRGNYESMKVNHVLQQLEKAIDQNKREELWRQAGDLAYAEYMNVNLFSLPVELAVNPKVVSDWAFPGAITGSYTHMFNIKAAK